LEKVVIIVYNDIEVLADETDCKDMILRNGPSELTVFWKNESAEGRSWLMQMAEEVIKQAIKKAIPFPSDVVSEVSKQFNIALLIIGRKQDSSALEIGIGRVFRSGADTTYGTDDKSQTIQTTLMSSEKANQTKAKRQL
jgi:hypothetical protein